MVMDRDVQGLRGGGDFTRHVDVRTTGRRIATRMIVHQNDGGGAEFERTLDNLARINGRVVDRAARLNLVGDEDVLAVEEKDTKFLIRIAGHGGGAIVD